jgi:hypothetical protein
MTNKATSPRMFPYPILVWDRSLIQFWARWLVGISSFDGHSAAVLCAWNESSEFFVIDGFKIEHSKPSIHIDRIADMCRDRRIPIAWRLEDQALADDYRGLGAPMLETHAHSEGKTAIEEICDHMKDARFSIAKHMNDLADELLTHRRDENYRLMVSATRCAFVMRRSGIKLEHCERYNRSVRRALAAA